MKKLLALGLALATVAAQAQVTILYNDGFESQANGTTLSGMPITGGSATGNWTAAGTSATATYSNEQANAGSQSAKIVRTSSSGTFYIWGDTNGGAEFPYSFEQRTIFVEADFFLPVSPNNNSWIGLDGWGGGILGSVGIAGDGRVIAMAPDTNGTPTFYLTTDELGNTLNVAKGAWNQLRVKLEYTDASNVDVSYFINNVPVYAGASTPFEFGWTGAGVLPLDFDIVSRNFALGLAPSFGATAYVDNYRVVAIPEPGSMIALGVGVAAVIRRRRKAQG